MCTRQINPLLCMFGTFCYMNLRVFSNTREYSNARRAPLPPTHPPYTHQGGAICPSWDLHGEDMLNMSHSIIVRGQSSVSSLAMRIFSPSRHANDFFHLFFLCYLHNFLLQKWELLEINHLGLQHSVLWPFPEHYISLGIRELWMWESRGYWEVSKRVDDGWGAAGR